MKKVIYPFSLVLAGLVTGCGGGSSSSSTSSSAGYMVFRAEAEEEQPQLWRTDGTAQGSYAIHDFGEAIFEKSEGYRNFHEIVPFGKRYVFAAPYQGSWELMVTNGTRAGTQLFIDVTSSGGSYPSHMTRVGDSIYFRANTDNADDVLVISNGTEAGTTVIESVVAPGYFNSVSADQVFFTGLSDAEVYGLYVTDGSEAGTRLVFTPGAAVAALPAESEIEPSDNALSVGDSYPNIDGKPRYVAFNDRLYFYGYIANAGGSGARLFSTDSSGFDVRPELQNDSYWVNSLRSVPIVANGKLYVIGRSEQGIYELFELDDNGFRNISQGNNLNLSNADLTATSLGIFVSDIQYLAYFNNLGETTVLDSLIKPQGGDRYEFAEDLFEVNGTVYFAAQTTLADGYLPGYELWKTDGTDAGTVFVKDINTTAEGEASNPFSLYYDYSEQPVLSGKLASHALFGATDGVHGYEPWVSDGSAEGTVMLQDIKEGSDTGFWD